MKSTSVLIPNILPWTHSDCQDCDTFSSGSCPLEWLHFLHLSPLCFSAYSSQVQGHLLEGALTVPPNQYQASPLCSHRWLLYFDTSMSHAPSQTSGFSPYLQNFCPGLTFLPHSITLHILGFLSLPLTFSVQYICLHKTLSSWNVLLIWCPP